MGTITAIKLPARGDLFSNTWGTTMSRTNFYQVIHSEKNKYWLTRPIVEASGNTCQGEVKLIGKRVGFDGLEVVAHAKMHRGQFVLCDKDFRIKTYCNRLEPAIPGETHTEYSD
jgi:hypothetical protein